MPTGYIALKAGSCELYGAVPLSLGQNAVASVLKVSLERWLLQKIGVLVFPNLCEDLPIPRYVSASLGWIHERSVTVIHDGLWVSPGEARACLGP